MVALVTGAGVRVGRAIALALAEAGHDLVLHASSSRAAAEDVARLVEGMGRSAEVHDADLSDPDQVDRLAAAARAAHPTLDVLVNNAGIFERVAYEDVDRSRYRRMMAINLDAPYFLTRALLPSLRAAQDPLVVFLADIAAERPVPRYSHYTLSKAGVVALTRALALELAPRVRVNAIAPGTVAFPEDFDEGTRARVLARVPLQREGTPEDVAGAVVYLTRAPYVTGQILAVDGGRSAVL